MKNIILVGYYANTQLASLFIKKKYRIACYDVLYKKKRMGMMYGNDFEKIKENDHSCPVLICDNDWRTTYNICKELGYKCVIPLFKKRGYFNGNLFRYIKPIKYFRFMIDMLTSGSLKKDKYYIYTVQKLCTNLKMNVKIAIVGESDLTYKLHEQIKKQNNLLGIISFRRDNNLEKEQRSLSMLLKEKIHDLFFIVDEENQMNYAIGRLLELGADKNKIFSIRQSDEIGPAMTSYDIVLGQTYKGYPYPGFKVFGTDIADDNIFRIITLGGSTTSPFLYNIPSWSEKLYAFLSKLGIKVEIICGGVDAFTINQELLKLVRDCIPLKPDLVISYSGVNDFSDTYSEEGTPFVLKRQKTFMKRAFDAGMIDFVGVSIESDTCDISYGIVAENAISRAEHWIKCNRMMNGICNEFNIPYYGILQPHNTLIDDLQSKYRQNAYDELAKKKDLSEFKWFIDYTHIFDGIEDVYYDNCHVFEKGNEIIARKLLPLVLSEIRRKRDVHSGNIGIIS